jgi:hypothetical protein
MAAYAVWLRYYTQIHPGLRSSLLPARQGDLWPSTMFSTLPQSERKPMNAHLVKLVLENQLSEREIARITGRNPGFIKQALNGLNIKKGTVDVFIGQIEAYLESRRSSPS